MLNVMGAPVKLTPVTLAPLTVIGVEDGVKLSPCRAAVTV